jgi:transposase
MPVADEQREDRAEMRASVTALAASRSIAKRLEGEPRARRPNAPRAKVADPPPTAKTVSAPTRSVAQEGGAKERSAMRNVALDLGARKIALCEVANDQVLVRATASSLNGLKEFLGPATRPARVLFEAGRGAWPVHAQLGAWGHEPLMLDTTRAKQIGIGQHGKKTDRIDAEVLARALEHGRIPLAHVLSDHRQELRFHLGVRRTLVETRAVHVATVREIARARGFMIASCSTEAFTAKVESGAGALDEDSRDLIDPLLKVISQLDAQVVVAEAKLEQLSSNEPVIRLLQTAPGVAGIVAAAFVSVIDDAGRFTRAHQVEAYLGLVPSEDSSGGHRRVGSITKQGNGYARAMLVQAAWSILRPAKSEDPLHQWAAAIAKRRGARVAIIALARRLAGVLWSMWRHDTAYEPARLAAASGRGLMRQAQTAEYRADALLRAAKKLRSRPAKKEAKAKRSD